MEILILLIFIIGYLLISVEHTIKINKTATALITGVLCWTLFVFHYPNETLLSSSEYAHVTDAIKNDLGESKFSHLSQHEVYIEYVQLKLSEHLGEIAQILFFLIGAMTIVELIDVHRGFRFITERIRTQHSKKLLWIICWTTFFLSAVLDNLTTTIVMVSLTRKLIPNRDMRLFFTGLIVVAANAGGAWSPIGDVTTTMLWIGGQVSGMAIIRQLFIPSAVCMLVPLIYLNFTLKGSVGSHEPESDTHNEPASQHGNLMLALGLLVLIGVPVFKIVTHLPPYIGMMLGLGLLWVVSELINPHADESIRKKYTAAYALSRIDIPSILFFLGILLTVGVLESMLTLQHFAEYLSESIGDNRVIISLIGVLSAIVDNVPLVAASMGMYSLETYPTDHMIWEYLAYCTGTGGSLLIIGSAAGVAAMGMEKIDFIWYVKKISLLALLGYISGAITYLLLL